MTEFRLSFYSKIPRPPAVDDSRFLAHIHARAAATQAEQSIAAIDAVLGSRRQTVECRSAAMVLPIVDVNSSTRTVTCIAVPYESPATVVFRGQAWAEVFTRGAFTGIAQHTSTIRVNRDHDITRPVGGVVRFDTDDWRGLITEMVIARTQLGDETLALAAEDCLSASVGFAVSPGGEQLDYRAKLRRVTRATLVHVALVANPAYTGASVLAVG